MPSFGATENDRIVYDPDLGPEMIWLTQPVSKVLVTFGVALLRGRADFIPHECRMIDLANLTPKRSKCYSLERG